MRMPSLIAFFSATFALTWASWLTAAALARSAAGDGFESRLPFVLLYLGIFAPAIVGLALTYRSRGSEGVHDLLVRLLRWRVAVRWYAFALGYLAAVKLLAAGAHRLTSGTWPVFGFDAWHVLLAGTLLSTVAGSQAGEEVGWRGYALPRLERLVGLGAGSVALGVLWATWHLPRAVPPLTHPAVYQPGGSGPP